MRKIREKQYNRKCIIKVRNVENTKEENYLLLFNSKTQLK